MKLLFVWFDIASGHKPGPNHGLAWLSSFLKSKGHDIACLHIRDENRVETIGDEIKAHQADCIGLSLVTNQMHYLKNYIPSIRAHFKGPIIAGGVHPTLDPESVIQIPEIDGVCIGEGEYPMRFLGERIDKNQSLEKIPSFWWKKKDGGSVQIIKNDMMPFEKDLEQLPFPDYSIFETVNIQKGLGDYANIMISRGCPYNCTYCCNHAIKSVYPHSTGYFRMLKPDSGLRLLENYKEQYPNTKGFIFEDDRLLADKKWFDAFSRGYEEKIALPYICNGRFQSLQDADTVHRLKDSGCFMIMLGLESGEETFRKETLKRGYTNAHIYRSVELFHEVGLPFFTYNIFGFPFESKEQMQKTVSVNMKIRPFAGQISFFYPYPNTALYDICKKHDLLIPEKMDAVSGYFEKPVIKLPNCTVRDCVRLKNKLVLYLAARRWSRVLHVDRRFIDTITFRMLMIAPSLFARLFTRESWIKKLFRKLQYLRMKSD